MAGLELKEILLLLPLECWDYVHVSPCLSSFPLYSCILTTDFYWPRIRGLDLLATSSCYCSYSCYLPPPPLPPLLFQKVCCFSGIYLHYVVHLLYKVCVCVYTLMWLMTFSLEAEIRGFLGSGLHQKHLLRSSKEQVITLHIPPKQKTRGNKGSPSPVLILGRIEASANKDLKSPCIS